MSCPPSGTPQAYRDPTAITPGGSTSKATAAAATRRSTRSAPWPARLELLNHCSELAALLGRGPGAHCPDQLSLSLRHRHKIRGVYLCWVNKPVRPLSPSPSGSDSGSRLRIGTVQLLQGALCLGTELCN